MAPASAVGAETGNFQRRSGDDLFDRLTVVDGEAFAARHFQPMGVETHQLQDGGVDVGDIVAVFDGMETEFVGGSMRDTAFDAAPCQPGGEALRMVIPP